jgi:alpha-beta hydrolase superfamily lysophospholipase
MKKPAFASFLTSLITFILTACSNASTVIPTITSVPSPKASPTVESLPLTPVESAFAPGNPTAAPTRDIIASHTVTFETADGVAIDGELYGSGRTGVILSVMGNCKPGWREFAQITAAQGLMALTYQWRGCRAAGSVDENEIQKFVEDLRGAINFMREQGAEKIILAGASLGGCASAKLAVESQARGLIVIASPPAISQWGFEIESADLSTDIPKLFITAENDDTVSANATRQLYDLAAEPKEWQTYPGAAHGTDLFETEKGDELQQRILEFILAIAR